MLAKRSLLAIAVMAAIASQSAWAFENHIYSGEYDTINDVDPTTIVTVVGGATAVSSRARAPAICRTSPSVEATGRCTALSSP